MASSSAWAIGCTCALVSGGAWAAAFEWVNGTVTNIVAHVPTFTVVMVSGRGVRFCDPETGLDYQVSAGNVQFEMLKTALVHGKSVQIGVQNFGKDSAGAEKLCIERVVLSN
jgi:hypothetical protein